jgi:hypothetical protein
MMVLKTGGRSRLFAPRSNSTDFAGNRVIIARANVDMDKGRHGESSFLFGLDIRLLASWELLNLCQ